MTSCVAVQLTKGPVSAGAPGCHRVLAEARSGRASVQLRRRLADDGITRSMSRAGNVRDNSRIESLVASPNAECSARKQCRTRDDVRSHVFGPIERFHNPGRRHLRPGYLSPTEFEARAMLA